MAGQQPSGQPGRGGNSGPNLGQTNAPGGGFTPEDTTFKKDRVRPTSGMSPRGRTVGSFVGDGPSPTGESQIEVGAPLEQAVQELSQQVEKEPLPVEHRGTIERYHELLLHGGEETSGGVDDAGAAGGAPSEEE